VKKYLLITILLFFIFPSQTIAEDKPTINEIQTQINVEKDSNLSVSEKILLNSPPAKITRVITKSIRADNKYYLFTTSNYKVIDQNNNNLSFKIKSTPDKDTLTISEIHPSTKYVIITFTVSKAIFSDEKFDFLFYEPVNPDTPNLIKSSRVIINIDATQVSERECIAGDLNKQEHHCVSEFDNNQARFSSAMSFGDKKGFIVKLYLFPNENLKIASNTSKWYSIILTNARYIFIKFAFWFIVIFTLKFIFENIIQIKKR
jgi:hypothetical protein